MEKEQLGANVKTHPKISLEPVIQEFNNIRGKSKKEGGFEFWDVVVLSTADEEQKKAYTIQIENKIKRKELPLDVPYIVVSDPPGPKVGNGGSIMHCLHILSQQFPEELFSWRVLIIPAGGQSQRLPSASVLGKVFTAIPLIDTNGSTMYQMLDLQLALFLPFLSKMQPGVFIACPDIIVTFNLDKEDDDWSFSKPGFTVFAHPGTIELGKGHGVYVVDNPHKLSGKTAEFANCLEVLQKPSEEVMRNKGAVVCTNGSEEMVYIDSTFFFDHQVSQKLLSLYNEIAPLSCEIDGYGDFLQSVGPRASIAFTNNVSNVSSVLPELVLTRQKVFHALQGTTINLVMLNESRFNHIGSTEEYLYHYCSDRLLSREMSLRRSVLVSYYDSLETKRSRVDFQGTVLHSKLHSSSTVAPTSVIEYCDIDVCLDLHGNCILSNCQFIQEVGGDLTNVEIPTSSFVHTVPVTIDGECKYVTVVFDVKDNLKKKVSRDKCTDLSMFGKGIKAILPVLGGKSAHKAFAEDQPCGLWFAKLFPAAQNMSESFLLALKLLHFAKGGHKMPDFSSFVCLSMHDVLNKKDVHKMIEFRNRLGEKL